MFRKQSICLPLLVHLQDDGFRMIKYLHSFFCRIYSRPFQESFTEHWDPLNYDDELHQMCFTRFIISFFVELGELNVCLRLSVCLVRCECTHHSTNWSIKSSVTRRWKEMSLLHNIACLKLPRSTNFYFKSVHNQWACDEGNRHINWYVISICCQFLLILVSFHITHTTIHRERDGIKHSQIGNSGWLYILILWFLFLAHAGCYHSNFVCSYWCHCCCYLIRWCFFLASMTCIHIARMQETHTYT